MLEPVGSVHRLAISGACTSLNCDTSQGHHRCDSAESSGMINCAYAPVSPMMMYLNRYLRKQPQH